MPKGESPGAKTTGEEKAEGAHTCYCFGFWLEVCDGAAPIVEVECRRRTSQELTFESEAMTGREP